MSERVMSSFEEALERVLAAVSAPRPQRVRLEDALGRILYEDLRAAEDFPLADNSAMDGFAVRAADLAPGAALRLVGDALAGRPFAGPIPPGACVRVMTGGLIPSGADAVVPVERSSGYAPRDGLVHFDGAAQPGENIRPRGCVRGQGELLVPKGREIRPGVVGVLAQQGCTEVVVGARPEVAILPTGDEVVPIDVVPEPGQVRDSNAWALAAQVRAAGGVAHRLPVLGDDEVQTRDRLGAALAEHDLVCTIGGVSMGTKDLVRASFEALGGECLVESVHIKPGKPTYFGRLERDGRTSFLLGLPGNPASSFTIFALLGEPFCRVFQGEGPEPFVERSGARLADAAVQKNRRLQALPGRLWHGPDATIVEHVPEVNSADLFCLADADVFFLAPADTEVAEGDAVEWIPLR